MRKQDEIQHEDLKQGLKQLLQDTKSPEEKRMIEEALHDMELMEAETQDIERLHSKKKINIGSTIVVSSLILGLVLTLSLPDDILKNSTILLAFVEWVESVIPSVSALAAISRFPDVTRLFFSIMWALVPVQALLFYIIPGIINLKVELFRKNKLVGTSAIFLLAIGGFFVTAFLIANEGTKDKEGWMLNEIVVRHISESRFWMGALGSLMFVGFAFAIAAFVVWFKHIPDIYFSSKQKGIGGPLS